MEDFFKEALAQAKIPDQPKFEYKKQSLAEWQKWAQAEVAKAAAFTHDQRIAQCKNQRVLFLPYTGEFGHLIMHSIRLVHFSEATEKVVCIKAGQEVLYPSATSFHYDWIDPVPDQFKIGTDRTRREWPEITKLYPDYLAVEQGCLISEEEELCYSPEKRIPFKPKQRDIKVDVVIGARKRQFLPGKNWPYYPQLAKALTENGYSFAVLGTAENAEALDGAKYISGSFGDIDAAIELLQGCRLFCGQDGGGAHLASTVGTDMIVWDVPNQISTTTRKFFGRMQSVNQDHKMIRIQDDLWNKPEAIINTVLETLGEKQ